MDGNGDLTTALMENLSLIKQHYKTNKPLAGGLEQGFSKDLRSLVNLVVGTGLTVAVREVAHAVSSLKATADQP